MIAGGAEGNDFWLALVELGRLLVGFFNLTITVDCALTRKRCSG